MRYQRWFNYAEIARLRGQEHAFDFSKRRLAAAEKRHATEREEAGLFAAEVAAEQPTARERLERIERRLYENHLADRASRARSWRKARAAIAREPAARQAELRKAWAESRSPANPEMLLTMLQRMDVPLECCTCGVVFRWSEGTAPHAATCNWAIGVNQSRRIEAEFAERRRREADAPQQRGLPLA